MSGGALYENVRAGTLSKAVVESADRTSMYHMLPIIASSVYMLPLPFRACTGDPLLESFLCKIEVSRSLQQRLRMYLYSYYHNDSVQALWGDHPAMPAVVMLRDMAMAVTSHSEDGDDMASRDDEAECFEDHYLEKDSISFLRKMAENAMNGEIEVGDEISVDSVYGDIYDVMGKEVMVSKVKIEKVFKSNAKPVLMSALQKHSDSKYKHISRFIAKRGDDLRLDAGAMHMFRFFNSIWSEEGLSYDGYPVQCLLYIVVPMGTDFGCIEYIPHCKALRNAKDYFGKFGKEELKNLVASSAGSYIASFVLGVRDRHFDNVLIRKDGTLFHIDFGYVMGSKLFMDTSKIAITGDLCRLFEEEWEHFIETAVNAFMTLRLHYDEILEFSHLVFADIDLECDSEQQFLWKMLNLHLTDRGAEDAIRNKLASAPTKWNTKIKNAAHYVATL